MPRPISHFAAILLAIAGFTCFVLCDSAMKLAGQSHLPTFEIIAFLGLSMAGFVFVYAAIRREANELWPERPRRLAVRSALDLGNNLCVVVALRHLPLNLFYILVFTSPLMVSVLGRLFLKERLDWRKAFAILVGFLGVVVAVWPARSSGKADWVGFAACAICVTCFSISVVWSRVIVQAERAESMTFFSGLVTAAFGVAGVLFHAAPVSGRLLTSLLAMGLLGAIGSICVFVALKHTTAATVSQYHYSQLVSGSIVAYLLFQEEPTVWMLGGATLIVAAGLYIAVHGEPLLPHTSQDRSNALPDAFLNAHGED